MTSACGALAVGDNIEGGLAQPFVLRLTGPAWAPQSAPAYPDQVSSLSGVAATSDSNAWAVGYGPPADGARGTFQALILHWDGHAWTRVSSPPPSGAHLTELNGVTATSASNAWAVGSYFDGTAHQTLTLHWNGHVWTRVPSPNPAGQARFNTLTAVTAISGTNAWAVGYALPPHTLSSSGHAIVLHWNGKHWRQAPLPDPSSVIELTGVTATSPNNAWAVGFEQVGGGAEDTVIFHWNGRRWERQPSPNRSTASSGLPAEDVLDAVAATSAHNAWAVGDYRDPSGNFSALILHWNGRVWRWVTSPGSGILTSVAAASTDNAWAAGPDIVAHWNGATWQS